MNVFGSVGMTLTKITLMQLERNLRNCIIVGCTEQMEPKYHEFYSTPLSSVCASPTGLAFGGPDFGGGGGVLLALGA